MKKILALIIVGLSIFSNFYLANANEWLLEKELDLVYWVEEMKLKIKKVPSIYLKNQENKRKYNLFKKSDSLIREAIISDYKNWKTDYNSTNWIIDNYNLFVYHMGKYFYYTSVKENNPKYSETDYAILKNFSLARSYMKEIKNILERTK